MRKKSYAMAALLASIAGAACRPVIPPAPPPFSITGIVESNDGHTLQLRHKSGQRVRIAVTEQTAIDRRHQPAGLAEIAVGMRIVVVYRLLDGALVADAVHLFRPPIKAAT